MGLCLIILAHGAKLMIISTAKSLADKLRHHSGFEDAVAIGVGADLQKAAREVLAVARGGGRYNGEPVSLDDLRGCPDHVVSALCVAAAEAMLGVTGSTRSQSERDVEERVRWLYRSMKGTHPTRADKMLPWLPKALRAELGGAGDGEGGET